MSGPSTNPSARAPAVARAAPFAGALFALSCAVLSGVELSGVELSGVELSGVAPSGTVPSGMASEAGPPQRSSARAARGLHLHLERIGEVAGSLAADDRRARLLALYVPGGAPVSPFFEPGPFRATWTGSLEVPRRDRYAFTFVGRGLFELEVDGEVVLKASGDLRGGITGDRVRLSRGARAIRARYTTPLRGAAAARVLWESRRFGPEPIPPEVLSHEPDDEGLRLGRLRRRGRELIAERHCLACHAGPTPGAAGGMPELTMSAPDLDRVGARLTRAWLAVWIRGPRALRPDARMPHVLSGGDGQAAQAAADIAACLAEDGEADGSGGEPEPAAGDAGRGGARFRELGCFACHDLRAPAAVDAAGGAAGDASGEAEGDSDAAAQPAVPEQQAVSLAFAAAKYRPGALAAFLRAPGAHHPGTRMPDFRLGERAARDLEAFVRAAAPGSLPPAPPGDPARGEARMRAAGCWNCHGVERAPEPEREPEREIRAQPLQELLDSGFARAGAAPSGCVADSAERRGAAPDFGFDAPERRALRAFAAAGAAALASLGRCAEAEFAARQVRARRCVACHAFDGESSLWTARAPRLAELGVPAPEAAPSGDAGGPGGHVEVAQLRPALTWVGEKLRPSWLAGFLAGEIDSPRPWLRARMPSVPRIAQRLARGLAAQHGQSSEPPAPPEIDPGLVGLGRRLLAQQGGFGCVTCHGVGDRAATQVFEVHGINFRATAERLRREYYMRWMMDPPRIEPAAKMPKFADDRGRTAFTEILDGDARRQFAAIWQFLHGAEELR